MLATAFSFTVSELGILVAVVSTVLGASIATSRSHIKTRVEATVDGRVDVAVGQAMSVISAKLDGIRINQEETSAAIGRVHDLEVTIRNGLSAEVVRIGRQVDGLVAANQHWDGDERRTA